MRKIAQTLEWEVFPSDGLPSSDRALRDAALEAARRAYAPYSAFRVGCAVRLADGTVVTGSNQENAAFPSGICAERVALFSAGAVHPDLAPTDLALVAEQNGAVVPFISPCGACRQVMMQTEERHGRPLRVLLCGRGETIAVASVRDLMPLWNAPELQPQES